mmetsp:Transcript_6894/g.16429  ORF Transcript_6894/g.16429 Transcript_6894/m.16429 type:complete len:225 (-) Transcript_6894:71-745(-)
MAASGGAGGDDGSVGFLEQTVGPNGFRNIKPRTRQQRRQLADKETLEKSRLRERTGGYHKYIDYGKGLTSQQPGSAGYIPEADRFHTDVAGEEKLLRDARVARGEQIISARREANAAREGERWARIDAAARNEAERWDEIRETGERAKRNKSSVPYNPLTLEYHESHEGLKLRYADDLVRYRAAQRAYTLQSHDVSTDYNPISGGALAKPTPPARPPAPDGLAM